MHDANALFDDLQQVKWRQTVVAVCMKFDGNITGVVENQTRQGTSALRREHAADIFVAQAIGLKGSGLARFARVVFIRMSWRDRVDDVHHRFHASLFKSATSLLSTL